MTRMMKCKSCKFTWMAKSADYCPRCKETDLEAVEPKNVEVREQHGTDGGPVTEGTPDGVPSKDQS